MLCFLKWVFIEWIMIQVKVKKVMMVVRLIKKVSWVVREKGCLVVIWYFKYIVDVVYGLDQFWFEVVINFGVQLFYCYVNGVSVVVEVYILYL